jgi:Superfamily II DNA/RNA helicases, SNF2 family
MNSKEIRNLIKQMIGNDKFIDRGYEYYFNNQVEIESYIKNPETSNIDINSLVWGSKKTPYTQEMFLEPNYDKGFYINENYCTCLAYQTYNTCKHLAAVLFKCEEKYLMFSKVAEQNALQLSLGGIFEETLEEIDIEKDFYTLYPEILITKKRFNEYEFEITLTTQAGIIIREANLSLLYSYYAPQFLPTNNGSMPMNKFFFSQPLDTLEEILQNYIDNSRKIRRTYLASEITIAKFLSELKKHKDIPVYYQKALQLQTKETKPIKITIENGVPEYEFVVDIPPEDVPNNHLKEIVSLKILPQTNAKETLPLGFYLNEVDSTLVVFDDKTSDCLATFLLIDDETYRHSHRILIPFSSINQYIKEGNLCDIKVSATTELLAKVQQFPLQIELQATKDEYGMRIEPFFIYENILIEALTRKRISVPNEFFYIDNDAEKEFSFLELLSGTIHIPFIKSNSRSNNYYHIESNEAILNFLEEKIPILVENGVSVLLDRALQIMRQQKFNISINVQWIDEGLLAYDIESTGLEFEELRQIMQQYKMKTRYIKLENGAILDKHNKKIAKQLEQLENIDLNLLNTEETSQEIPLYRALGIAAMKTNKQLKTHFDTKTATMLKELQKPQAQPLGLPENLKAIMRPYQLIGVYWLQRLASYNLGGILADDMGLGKTLQVIAYLTTCSWQEPIMIIAPKTLIYNWQNEFTKFAPNLKTTIIDGSPTERAKQLQETEITDIIITSYPLIIKDYKNYPKFSYIFIDEAQYIKNPQTKLARTITQLESQYRFALSGTPFENNLLELWSIFNFLMPGFFPNKKEFNQTVIAPIHNKKDNDVLTMLKNKIQYVVLRRLKMNVLKELPDKIETQLYCELPKRQREIYQYYFQQAQTTINTELATEGFARSQIKILAILTRLRQICTHPGMFLENYDDESAKLELLKDVLEDALSSGHKVLLFSQFTSMLEIIAKELEQQDIQYYYLHGKTKAKDRVQMMNNFNEEENNIKIFLLSLKAGGTGLNLTAADIVIHFDPWWNPSVENQATDRAHRFGQKNTVQVFQFIAKNTIEEKIQKIKEKKQEMFNTLFNDEQTAFKQFSEDDIKILLELE